MQYDTYQSGNSRAGGGCWVDCCCSGGRIAPFMTTGDTYVDVVFPVEFEAAPFFANWSIGAQALTSVIGHYIDNVTTTGMRLWADKETIETASLIVLWFAIGI